MLFIEYVMKSAEQSPQKIYGFYYSRIKIITTGGKTVGTPQHLRCAT